MRDDVAAACQFQWQDVDERRWAKWLVKDDRNHLCLKATGWYYRASAYTARFAVVNGLLHNDYWTGLPQPAGLLRLLRRPGPGRPGDPEELRTGPRLTGR